MSEPSDEEWLLARERGEDVSHIPAERRAKYERLGEMIANLRTIPPRVGWEDRVLKAILPEGKPEPEEDAASGAQAVAPGLDRSADAPAQEPPGPTVLPVDPIRPIRPPRRRTIVWASLGALAAAATASVGSRLIAGTDPDDRTEIARHTATDQGDRSGGGKHATTDARPAVAYAVAPPEATAAGDPSLEHEVVSGPVKYRAGPSTVVIGDTLRVHGRAAAPSELRVYSETKLLGACHEGSTTAGCRVTRSGEMRDLTLDVVMNAPGDVRMALFIGDAIPRSTGSLNDDIAAADRAGITYKPGDTPIRVH